MSTRRLVLMEVRKSAAAGLTEEHLRSIEHFARFRFKGLTARERIMTLVPIQ